MAGYGAGLIDLIDTRIAAARTLQRKVGTFVGVESGYAMITFDGSNLALPCKYIAAVPLTPDARVTVDRYGSDWVVTGTFSQEWPQTAENLTAINGFTNTGGQNGSPIVEIQFDAPASGSVIITLGGQVAQATAGNTTSLSYRLVQGRDYASGVEVQPFDARRGIVAGRAATGEASGTFRWPVTGLIPGEHYIARTGHWVSPAGSGNVVARYLMAEPNVGA